MIENKPAFSILIVSVLALSAIGGASMAANAKAEPSKIALRTAEKSERKVNGPSEAERERKILIFSEDEAIPEGTTLREIEAAAILKNVPRSGLPEGNPLKLLDSGKKWERLARELSKRYKIKEEYARHWVAEVVYASAEQGVDPLLVIALAETESRFKPEARSNMGAMGLMQIVPKYHPKAVVKIGGEEQLADPVSNIRAGVETVKLFMSLAKGDTTRALLMYNGSLKDSTKKYAKEVLKRRSGWAETIGKSSF